MAAKYQDYLAANVLVERKPVSYRLLSRALKIHVNTAKEMLYDFHQKQNASTPHSVHATYLICGIPKSSRAPHINGSSGDDGEDAVMQDVSFTLTSSASEPQHSPFQSTPTNVFTLVTQEHLEDVKLSYSRISSTHIYSLEPGPLNNVYILSDCNSAVNLEFAAEDPLETWKQYGTIYDPTSKRRHAHRNLSSTAAPQTLATAGMKPANPPVSTSKPQPPKSENSAIFKSFGKASKQAPVKPVAPVAKIEEDQDDSMRDTPLESEDDGEEDAEEHMKLETDKLNDADRKAKAEREAALRKMMEQDSDPELDTREDDASVKPMVEEPSPELTKDETGDRNSPFDGPTTAQDNNEPLQERTTQVTTSNGRRRGRRRVLKKKTTKDAEGYLVTKEEPVWESFSEDETTLPEKSKASISTPPASASTKSKKTGSTAKPGQGNIMNFFGKR